MMLRLRNVSHWISGSNNKGEAPREMRRQRNSSSTSMAKGCEQWWHFESIRTRSF